MMLKDYGQVTQSIKEYMQTLFGYHVVVVIVILAIAKATYQDMGSLIFAKTAITTLDTPFDAEELVLTYASNVTEVLISSPLNYIYKAVPFTEQVSIFLVTRFDEVLEFSIPDDYDLLDLDPSNLYTPIFPSTVVQYIDVEKLADPEYLLDAFFSGDAELNIGTDILEQWDFVELATRDLSIDTSVDGPHVLIYHTHSQEVYIDEDWRDHETGGVIAVGNALVEELERRFGVEVLHITDSFYLDGSRSTDGAYGRMETYMERVIEENPSIQLSIDIHRDHLGEGAYLAGEVNGEPAAKLMLVNGLTQWRNLSGELVYMQNLVNNFVEDNLAVSIQTQIVGLTYYPDLLRKIYLKPYRYGMHMLPNTMVIEVGSTTNTLEEALNSIVPIADILGKVFSLD